MSNKTYRNFILVTLLILILAALLILISTGRMQAMIDPVHYKEAGTGEYRLPVFGTSDIHGSLVNRLDAPYQYRMAYIADKVDDLRRTEEGSDPDRLILIDAGDIYQGTAASNLVDGESMSAVYDQMKYDAVAVGNHEFDWGIDTVIDGDKTMRDYSQGGRKKDNQIPVVCCNLYQNGEKVDFAKDYVILNKSAVDDSGEKLDVKVAVIGFAENYSGSIPAKDFSQLGFSIKTDYDEVNRIASDLEKDDKCDATILLAHGGAETIAKGLGASSDVDLVIGGHLHQDIEGVTDGGIRYLAPAGKGFSYMYSELVFENDGEGGARRKADADDRAGIVTLKDRQDQCYDTKENADEIDHEVVDITNEYLGKIDKYLKEEIGYITAPLTRNAIKDSGKRVSAASNFVTNAMLRGADVEVAFVNSGGVREDINLKPGEDRHMLHLADIYSMLPFDDMLYCYEITYEELLDVFNYSMNSRGRSLLTCMSGMDCYFINDPTDDGSSGEKYRRTIVDALVIDGEPVYRAGQWKDGWKDRKVRMVTTDFSATTNRNEDGMDNPLCSYNETDRLVSNDRLQRDVVLDALRREAEENKGELSVDTAAHFIYRAYDGNQGPET